MCGKEKKKQGKGRLPGEEKGTILWGRGYRGK